MTDEEFLALKNKINELYYKSIEINRSSAQLREELSKCYKALSGLERDVHKLKSDVNDLEEI